MDPYPGERAPRPARRYANTGAAGTSRIRGWEGSAELRGPVGRARVRTAPVSRDPDPELDAPPPPMWRRRGRRRRAMPLWQELPLLLVVAFCLAVLIRTFLLQAFFIPSKSMVPELLVGDRVLVNKIVFDMRDPIRGEVIVFRGTEKWAPEFESTPPSGMTAKITRTVAELVGVGQPGEKDFIKRVIGLPGDTVQCCSPDGKVMVNGKPLDESAYLSESRNNSLQIPPSPGACGPRYFGPVKVPPGYIWVMGDNRAVSQDSRCQGPVPIENVIGRAFVVAWPQKRWHSVVRHPAYDQAAGKSGGTAAGTAATAPEPGRNPEPDTGAEVALVAPFLAVLAITARSRRRFEGARRRLLE